MSDSRRGLDSLPISNLYSLVLATLCHGWDAALKPIPKLTSVDLDGTFFFAPLAYLAATLVTALYFGQVWLFTMSAFGVVWLDSQMAWRAQKIGLEMMRKHIAEQAETARIASWYRPPTITEKFCPTENAVGSTEEVATPAPLVAEPEIDIEETAAEAEEVPAPIAVVAEVPQAVAAVPEALPVVAEPEIDIEEAVAEIEEVPAPIAVVAEVPQAVAAVPEAPPVVAEPEIDIEEDVAEIEEVPAEIEEVPAPIAVVAEVPQAVATVPEAPLAVAEPEPEDSLLAEVEAAVPVQPVVAVEEENEESLYDDTFTLMAEMEAVRRELTQVLDARKQERALKQAMAVATDPAVVATEDRGPPPQLPPRPPLIEVEEIPALPETDEDDTTLHVFSMEELEESTSSHSSLRSFGDFIEAAAGQEFSRPPSRLVNKEAPHFPIIDDVLKDFEASIRPIEMQPSLSAVGSDATDEHYEHDSGHSSEHGDSRNDSSGDENESRPDSPATSISSSNDDDADVKVEPLDFARPAFEHVDSGISMTVEEEAVEVEDVKDEVNMIAAAILGALEIPADEKTAMTVLQTELPIVELEQTIETVELPTKTVAPVPQRPRLAHASTSRPSRRSQKKTVPSRKNNGHKHIPKKVRLSASEKQKFLSRPAW